MKKELYKYLLPLIMAFFISCEDFVEIDPPRNEITFDLAFSDDATATSTISGLYSNMVSSNYSAGDLSKFASLCSDELNAGVISSDFDFQNNDLTSINGLVSSRFWGPAYSHLLQVNSILEELNESSSLTDSIESQLRGEALFMRAFLHFNLANLFGNIPIVTSTDFERNNTLSRSNPSELYSQIIQDLEAARPLVFNDFTFTDGERVRPIGPAVDALLARVHLYQENWSEAEQSATTIINSSDLFSIEADPNNVFLANSVETIWSLKPVGPAFVAPETFRFDVIFTTFTAEFMNSFEANDLRASNWIDSLASPQGGTFAVPSKYKEEDIPLQEYSVVFRLAEMYLIRAEARTQQGNTTGAIADLDVLRERAGLPLISATNPSIPQADLLTAIEQERKAELFTEWGHRWFDLRRTNRANEVLSGFGDKDWQETDVLWPVPQAELDINPNLLPQNSGY